MSLPPGSPRLPWPPPDHPSVMRAQPPGSAGWRFLLPMAPLIVMLFVVMLGLGSILFETLWEGTGLVGGVLVGLVSAALAFASVYRKARRAVTGTTVLLSPTGVELVDTQGFQVRLRWTDVTSVGPVNTRVTRSSSRAGAVSGAAVMRSQGVVGWGERVVSPHAPNWLKAQLAAQPHDPGTGKSLVAVSFAAAGPEDPTNPLLAQVRHYRPDLFGG